MTTTTCGTLEIVDNNMIKIITDEETELIIRRLIPSHKRFPLRVSLHPEKRKVAQNDNV